MKYRCQDRLWFKQFGLCMNDNCLLFLRDEKDMFKVLDWDSACQFCSAFAIDFLYYIHSYLRYGFQSIVYLSLGFCEDKCISV